MAKYRITLSNGGGPLDARTVEPAHPDDDSAEVGEFLADQVREMIDDCGQLHPGDKITVEEP